MNKERNMLKKNLHRYRYISFNPCYFLIEFCNISLKTLEIEISFPVKNVEDLLRIHNALFINSNTIKSRNEQTDLFQPTDPSKSDISL